MDRPIVHPKIHCVIPTSPHFSCGLPVFGAYKAPTNYWWAKCRESATGYLNSPKGRRTQRIYFACRSFHYHSVYRPTFTQELPFRIAHWFWTLETYMGWWDRTRIHPTQYEDAVHVWVSGGWMQNILAINLFVHLLRAAPFFTEGCTIEETLKKTDLLKTTLPAVWRFLNGYQHYNRRSRSGYWIKTFGGLSTRQVEWLLIDKRLVEERAHRLYVDSGCREGRDKYNWLQACKAFAIY